MRTLLILISGLTFGAIATNGQVYVRPVKEPVKTKVVKTVSSREVGARIFKASAYSLRGRTASGEPARSGIIAADPRVLPIGTRVRIKGMGVYVVKDTGGAIKGKRIDIWLPSNTAAMRFGRRDVELTVLE